MFVTVYLEIQSGPLIVVSYLYTNLFDFWGSIIYQCRKTAQFLCLFQGTGQRTKKRKAPAACHIHLPRTSSQMTEPDAATNRICRYYPTLNCTSPSNSTNTSTLTVDSNVSVVTSTPSKKESIQNHVQSPKRKLFSQRKSLVEFTPAAESGKSTQSSEYEFVPMVQVHNRKLNSETDDGICIRSTRYAAVAVVRKKSQHSKDITSNITGKSGGLFRKQSISEESRVAEKEGKLLEYNCVPEKSTLDNTSSERNLDIVSGKGTDSERNTHLRHSDSDQEMSEEEAVGRNYVQNIPTEAQAVLSKDSKTKVVSYTRGKQGEIIDDHMDEDMPYKRGAAHSKPSRHMLQGHRVTEKLSSGGSQDEVTSEKPSCEQNVQDLSDKGSSSEDGNFTRKMGICMKIQNTDYRHLSQNSCLEESEVCSCSHDDSLNKEDTAVGGTEQNTVKLKHIIPDNQNNTGKSSENADNEREKTDDEFQESNTNLICMQPHREENDNQEVQGLENNHGQVNIDGNEENSAVPLHDIYKIYRQNTGRLSFQEYVKETMNVCVRILTDSACEVLDCPEGISIRSNGNEQKPDNGCTEHASARNGIARSANGRTANNGYVDVVLTQQDPTVKNSEAPEHPVEKTVCSTSQNGCQGLSYKENLGSSPVESGR